MKIAHISSVHTPFDTRIFHKECRSLVEAGHEVSLIVPYLGTTVKDGVHIYGVVPRKSRVQRILITTHEIYKKACELDADVYHFHDFELAWVALLLRCRGAEVIYDVHEDLPNQIKGKFWIHRGIRPIVGKFAGMLEAVVSRYASRIIAATPTIAARFPSTKTIVVCNYPDIHEFNIGSYRSYTPRNPSAVYIGAVSRLRGIYEMVEALALVDIADCRLQVAGEFMPAELLGEISSLAGWKKVDYLGWQERASVQNILNKAKVGLVTLHPTQSYVDSYPVKLFEYMAAGIPVIASNFPLWKEIIEKSQCGILVDPLNPLEIADAIEYILTHPAEAAEMGKNGQRAVQELFNWEAESKKLLAVYERLLGRNASEMAT